MFHRTVRHVSKRIQLIGAFASGALLSGALMASTMHSPAAAVAAPRKAPRVNLPAPSRFDLLRNEAGSGDELSNRELSVALLDRHDSTGDSDDLYEAVVWIDRRREASDNTDLVARVVGRYCGQRVVRWHWLCIGGE
ncbi:hypothetical protein [Variovorax sp. OV700]|uniref:hypothetical protein n=1 Tax=Variovorax sp. OV700 TaxID=1882826 RepID=UPI000880A587|nr:hypothetical protein [Variovorax sp. OV700]SDH81265.1 hypothetical protein SAMN05444748_102520 [Variovorax sp. OV700]